MAKGDNKTTASNRVTDTQRYRYIGFEVFPGKPKDLFKNDAEKQKLIEGVKAKRESDSTLREDCTLLEERVSFGEKIILAVSSVIILAALVLPWYSVYTVVPIAVPAAAVPVAQTPMDSTMAAMETVDNAGGAVVVTETQPAAGATAVAGAVEEAAMEVVEATEPVAADEPSGIMSHAGERSNEQIITAHTARASTVREYESITGLGSFTTLGTVGSYVFGSGFVLIITGILMLIYALLCVALPVINLYSIFGLKGDPDDVALKLKRTLKLNWLPLILFVVVLTLSFVGADYGFNAEESFASLGASYSVATLLGTLSWGVFVSMAAAVLVAVKGIEI